MRLETGRPASPRTARVLLDLSPPTGSVHLGALRTARLEGSSRDARATAPGGRREGESATETCVAAALERASQTPLPVKLTARTSAVLSSHDGQSAEGRPERYLGKKKEGSNSKREGFKVLRERHTTGEMHFPLLVFTLSCSPRRPYARARARAG